MAVPETELVNTSNESRQTEGSALQRCVEPNCQKTYGLGERLYVCRRCGGLLDIAKSFHDLPAAEQLRNIWQARLASSDATERSGVWRYRELLPFTSDAP